MHCSLPGWNFGFLGVVEKQRQPIQVRRGWPGHLIVFSQGMQVLARGQVLFLNRKGCTSHSLLLFVVCFDYVFSSWIGVSACVPSTW